MEPFTACGSVQYNTPQIIIKIFVAHPRAMARGWRAGGARDISTSGAPVARFVSFAPVAQFVIFVPGYRVTENTAKSEPSQYIRGYHIINLI